MSLARLVSATSQPASTLYQFFAPGGVLQKTHPAYEFRRGQLAMAQAVEEALAEKRHLIVEAGTGTGKTLAYLMPVIRSGKRVIISTGTKNLQEQLFFKDVPFLERVFAGVDAGGTAGKDAGATNLRVCYMKGRNNYLCRKKLYDLTDQPVLNGLEEIEQYRAIKEWDETTTTGDRAELAILPETSQLWNKLDARSENCLGQKCAQFERCFITEMHRRAAESDIIIVNHHLFFADLAIKMATEDATDDAGILPEAGAVIFDEAHELEDVAGSYFGVSVSAGRFEELARDLEALAHKNSKTSPTALLAAAQGVRERGNFFFGLLPPGDGRFAFETRKEFLEENGDEYVGVMRALDRVTAELEQWRDRPDDAFLLARRVGEIRAGLAFAMESEDPNSVFWIERRNAGSSTAPRKRGAAPLGMTRGRQHIALQATPIDVSQILREYLFARLDTAVLTSATLAVGGGFDYVKKRLGLDHARELVVPSHFNYPEQAVLYVPPDLPDPRDAAFAPKASQCIRRLLEISRGRAFCLFTSYAQMHDIYDRLLGEIDYPLLIQGSAPKSALLEEFRATPHAVLFATSSFWQGVDVQGEQLSCVIIDRLPFAVPNDPVVAARIRAIDRAGGNAFFDYQVPSAVITLKQGFGRLIRSLHDRGLLALLDNRILKKQYGKVFVNSLPAYRRTTKIEEVEKFFNA